MSYRLEAIEFKVAAALSGSSLDLERNHSQPVFSGTLH